VKLYLPERTDPGGNFFRTVAFCLFCLAVSFGSANAAQNPGANVNNYPNVYVTKVLPEVTNGLGIWMWDKVTFNKQTVRLWNGFEVPKGNAVVRAELRIAADNAYKVWLDGQELGSGSDWRLA